MICSECISLTKWGIYVRSRAQFAQSHQRRFSRWLHNSRINVQRIYSPLIAAALAKWNVSEMTLIEDTTMLWDEYCLIRLSIQYRGRAIPLVWRVLRHSSSSVGFEVYQGMLKRAARLVPTGLSVRFLADRGNASTKLMRYLRSGVALAFSDSSQKQCLDLPSPQRLETTESVSSCSGRKHFASRHHLNQNSTHH